MPPAEQFLATPETVVTAGGNSRHAPPCAITVFGASGDLAFRKLFPALAGLADEGLLPDGVRLVGVARSSMTDDEFGQRLRESAPDAGQRWQDLAASAHYISGGYDDKTTFDELADLLADLDREAGTEGNRLFYLATIPKVFPDVIEALGTYGRRAAEADGFTRIVIEKPFGRDMESACQLDALCHDHFQELQIYRIDHYLGKETVQNLLALRFANAIFEPIWNRRYVDQVQITVAEQLGVEGRAGFYETAGALRDIVQNHVMQVVALTGMEPPVSVDAKGIHDQKVAVIQAIMPPDPGRIGEDVVRAQYGPGQIDGQPVPGYRQEPGVDPDSHTETFVAMKLGIDNWRWAGVPFYVRTGKRLPVRSTEVALQFHGVPHLPFAPTQARGLHPNVLVLRIQPDEGISLEFGAKVPGHGFTVRSVNMDFSYAETFAEKPHDGYERLLLDALVGDPTLFIRSDETEAAWRICDPILESWAEKTGPLPQYAAGSWGPRQADMLIEHDGHHWRNNPSAS